MAMTASTDPRFIIIQTIQSHYPKVQAIYLFGSAGTDQEWPESDIDVAVLLPPEDAKTVGSFVLSDLKAALETCLRKEIDLINLRLVSTVLQKEVVVADRRIFTGSNAAADEFEMLTLSKYQKLNEERSEIVASALADGRFLQV